MSTGVGCTFGGGSMCIDFGDLLNLLVPGRGGDAQANDYTPGCHRVCVNLGLSRPGTTRSGFFAVTFDSEGSYYRILLCTPGPASGMEG